MFTTAELLGGPVPSAIWLALTALEPQQVETAADGGPLPA